jgi:pimeloyl-ACP methyl ester carboxylesterase
VRFLTQFAGIDVCRQASRVRCPTLILHSRNDHRVPMRCGEELAALIPNSQLVTLPSNNHLLTASEPAWPELVREVRRFLAA